MTEYMDAFRAQAREMTAAGRIVYATGTARELTGDDIVRFSASRGTGGSLLPGVVLSGAYELVLAGGEARDSFGLSGARVELAIGIKADGEWHFENMGAFYADSVEADEQTGTVTLRGNDGVARVLSGAFQDGLAYPARLRDIWRHIMAQAGVAYEDEIPNGDQVIGKSPAWGDITLRRAASFVAAAAGGYVSEGANGVIALKKCWDGSEEAIPIGPDEYMEHQPGGESFGPVEALEVMPVSEEESEMVTFLTEDGVIPGVLNTITVTGNPLFIAVDENFELLCRGMLSNVAGMRTKSGRVVWRGCPGIGVGKRICVTDRRGNVTEGIVSRATEAFELGYEAELTCEVPEKSGDGVARAITEDGRLNGEALVGTVDGGLLRADSVSARAIAAGSITAEKIAAHALDAEVVSAVSAEVERIVAGEATADRLYAAMGELIALYADTAGIDYADVKDLVAGSAIITEGVGGKLYISRLAVTEGNIASLTVGELVVRGDDGRLFSVGVDDAGNVVTREKKIDNADIRDNSIVAGEKIVEGSITAGCLNVAEIFADTALIRAIKAANIDVADLFAAEATVNQVRAMTVSSIDNGSTLYLGEEAVRITTPEFSVRIPSGEEDGDALRIDEDGVAANTLSVRNEIANDYIAKRYGDAAVSYAVTSFSDVAQALNGRYLDRDVVINCNAGNAVWADVVTLRGIYGPGSITINGNGVQLSGLFTAEYCFCRITVNRLYANYRQHMTPYLTLNDCATSSTVTVTDKATYKATTVSTYRTAGTRFYGNNDYFYQGATYTYAKLYGYLWCSGAKALSGKTVRKATLRLRRVAGIGGGTAAKITLFASAKTSPSGDGTTGLTKLGDIGSIYDGEEKTFEIPAAAAESLISGGAIVFYTEEAAPTVSGGLSGRYAKFHGVGDYTPEITITYDSTSIKPGNSHEVTDGGFGEYLIKAGFAAGGTGGVVPVYSGGTGADNATDARANLGITKENLGISAETLGAVKKSGDTMTGGLGATRISVQGKNNYPTIGFKRVDDANESALIQTSANGQISFFSYHSEMDGASSRYWEGYNLPVPSAGLTANKGHKIYTSKNPPDVVTVGSTKYTLRTGTTGAAGYITFVTE